MHRYFVLWWKEYAEALTLTLLCISSSINLNFLLVSTIKWVANIRTVKCVFSRWASRLWGKFFRTCIIWTWVVLGFPSRGLIFWWEHIPTSGTAKQLRSKKKYRTVSASLFSTLLEKYRENFFNQTWLLRRWSLKLYRQRCAERSVAYCSDVVRNVS